jgi:hypothetical protein
VPGIGRISWIVLAAFKNNIAQEAKRANNEPLGQEKSEFVLTLFYTPLKKTFNTFKRFYADPAKNFSQYSSRVLKQPFPVPNTLKGFSIDPWKISTPPKGSLQTSSIILEYSTFKGSWENLDKKILIEKAYYLTKYTA